MAKLWEKRKAPKPIDWNESITNTDILTNEQNPTNTDKNNSGSQQLLSSHRILTIAEYAEMFKESVSLLRKRLEESTDSNPILVWDKDDEEAMNFVTAASNLRCYIFSIGLKSKFETKCNYFVYIFLFYFLIYIINL